MHELAIAEAVVRIAVEHARGARVRAVELEVGHLRQVVPPALEFAFGLASAGTPADGAELRIRQIPVTARCRTCGAESEQSELPFACRRCGERDVAILGGEELTVQALEIEEETAEMATPGG